MEVVFTLQRKSSKDDYMHGDIFAPDGEWVCHTLEDESREIKVPGETALFAGKFKILLRPLGESRLDERYTKHFHFYEGQLWLQDTPQFTYTYLHCGNDDDDTDGCVLVGLLRFVSSIGRSRDAYRVLYPLMLKELKAGNDLYLDIRNAE